ncbi:transcriptional activator NhaR [Humisphaera borealis]|uniref:Transcriptional activator NhaR n=1 Tax=Humisphaera borealis TaxID=2807512 RepID=A0A7M2X231_9BACT|nr:transcriptional activator NhaR [Humisphaera borealis]QOV91773.1 transcriptional activator NhaR [Humisphaera borealis]
MQLQWLNYHHLLYFWMVAREGSIAAAGRELLVAEPTISGQVKELERFFGEKLFVRSGRRLVLTEMGKVVFDYAGDIFSLGRQMLDTVRQRPTDRPLRLSVGVTDAMPKLVARRLLAPAMHGPPRVELTCHEDTLDKLLVDLSTFRLDLVLSDAPVGGGVKLKSHSHLLGESGVSFFAAPALARRLQGKFPASIADADLLLPTEETALRRALDQWFRSRSLRPRVVASIEDSALLKTFGQAGLGVFPAPTVVEKEVCRQYQVKMVGRTSEVRERFYAVTVDRKLRHPAVVAICDGAKGAFHVAPAATPPR